jgi:hypothetical protein
MDETLGVFHKDVFHKRPKINVLINLLRLLNVDIVLWSLGEDSYVRRVVNGFLPEIAEAAYKIFARKEARVSQNLYGYAKSSEHVRIMYEEPIFLMAVDDKVSENMDSQYDVRIYIKPYKRPNPSDRAITKVCEEIVESMVNMNLRGMTDSCKPRHNEEELEDDEVVTLTN